MNKAVVKTFKYLVLGPLLIGTFPLDLAKDICVSAVKDIQLYGRLFRNFEAKVQKARDDEMDFIEIYEELLKE